MLLISESIELQYLQIEKKYNLEEFLNKMIFKVADTPLTYRQVNSLASDNLLPNNRDKTEGWRKFNFKEIVYILLIHELKLFGMKHEQFKVLYDCFFKEVEKTKQFQINKYICETAIGCVFTNTEINLVIHSNGDVAFCDPSSFILYISSKKPYISIRLNDIVNHLLTTLDREPFLIQLSVTDVIMHRKVTPKEQNLLEIINNKEYNTIKIRKKNGDISVIHAEHENKPAINEVDFVKLLNEKDFQDISIVKRDGKIVNYKVEETIKLNY